MKKVLYVEDSAVSLYIIKRMMRMMEYELIEAYDGATGILTAIHESPDLILMDLKLPDMSGLDAIQRIKQHRNLQNIPIVALTSDASMEMKQQCLDAGCAGYLIKPISKGRLLKTLNQFTVTA